MSFSIEIESFITDFIKDLEERNVALFMGAGMSKAAGYVDWPELLSDIASDLGLSIDKEQDLISLAQYHVNENKGRAKINRKILEEFTQQTEKTENHAIISRLPITTVWTTNYDTLIEDSFKDANKIVDVKHEIKQLAITRPKRDVVIYKMHGDVSHPADAILTKEQYEAYYKTHELFITALSGDLVSKTFLFLGFSFTDPNLDYVLSRLNLTLNQSMRQHYTLIKKYTPTPDEDLDAIKYNKRKQQLRINELARYKIKALEIDDYSDITNILNEIEKRIKKKNIFITGSAEEYGNWDRPKAQEFIHKLSMEIIKSNFRIVNGFGWGVGSAVINGALEAIYKKPEKYSEDQLIIRPFPQFETGEKKLPELWEEYRQKILSLAGIQIIIFGNKLSPEGKIILANGVKREFEIAIQQNLIVIPIPTTNYMAKEIFVEVMKEPEKYYKGHEEIIQMIKHLDDSELNIDTLIKFIMIIIKTLNK